MRSLKAWLVENQEACARVACRDTGKTCKSSHRVTQFTYACLVIDAALGEILTTCSKLEWLIERGERVLRPERRASNWLLCYKTSEVHYDPLGVVAGIVSWNYRSLSFSCFLFIDTAFSFAQCVVTDHCSDFCRQRHCSQML